MRERSGVAHDRAVMPMRFGFADTFSGQLHFRACGAGPDIVLLPWLPASGRMYEAPDAAPGARRISRHRVRSRRLRPLPQEKPQLDRAAVRAGRARSLRFAAHRAVHRGRRTILRVGRRGDVVSVAGAGHRRRARWRAGTRARRTAQDDTARPRASHRSSRDDGGYRSFAFDVMRAHAQGMGSVIRAHRGNAAAGATNTCATTSSWVRGHRGRRRGGREGTQSPPTTCWRVSAKCRSACWS